MRALLERDFFNEVTQKRFFRLRLAVGAAPLAGLCAATMTGSSRISSDLAGRQAFSFTTHLVLWAMVLVLPPVFAVALARERVAGALQVLLTTPLSRIQIFTGIWGARVAIALLLALTSIPIVGVALTLGGVTRGAFGAWVIVLLLTILWGSVACMMIGALVRDVGSALRCAYLTLALPCLVLPMLASSPLASSGPIGQAFAFVWTSPLSVLDQITSDGAFTRSAFEALLAYAGFTGVACVIGVVVTLRALGNAQAHDGRGRRRRLTRSATIEQKPMMWLGRMRRRRFAFAPGVLGAILAIVLVEGVFVTRFVSMWNLTGGNLASMPTTGWHALHILGYLLSAAILGAASGATTFHREAAANTIPVLFSTPLSNGSILRGLLHAAFRSATPLLLLSWIHAAIGVAWGGITLSALFVYVPMSVFFYAFAVAHGLRIGLSETTATRASIRALLVPMWLPGGSWWIVLFYPALLFLAPFGAVGFFVMAVLAMIILGSWFPTALIVPLHYGSLFYPDVPMTLFMLLAVPLHARRLRGLVNSVIPSLFILSHDPKAGSRTWAKRYRLQRLGLRDDGQLRPEWR